MAMNGPARRMLLQLGQVLYRYDLQTVEVWVRGQPLAVGRILTSHGHASRWRSLRRLSVAPKRATSSMKRSTV